MMVPDEVDPQWYKKIWTMDIEDASWVEPTVCEVEFIIETLQLCGAERVLDLACGFGRHSLELSRRGWPVVGVDITSEYIDEANKRAKEEGLDAEFICADLRDVSFHEEFDVVLNLADGAIGYLEDEAENLKVFDLIASALKPGGKHLMGVCNAAYARKHFPRRHWEIGNSSVSLAEFEWDENHRRMLYRGHVLKYGDTLTKPEEKPGGSHIRLYTIDELKEIFRVRRMEIIATFGSYDKSIPACDDQLTLLAYSHKLGRQ